MMKKNNTFKNFAKWCFFLALFVFANNTGFAQSTIASVSCSNNGTFETATDDFLYFELTPDVTSSYGVTATFAGNPVTVNLMNNTAATNNGFGHPTYFKVANGGLGAGNFSITITPTSGSPETLTVANTGTCSTACSTASTNNVVTYYYATPYMTTDLTNIQLPIPKFDAGTTRQATKVKVDYGINYVASLSIPNYGSGPIMAHYSSTTTPSFSFAGNSYNGTYTLFQNANYPGFNQIPVGGISLNNNFNGFSGSNTYTSATEISNFVGTGTLPNSLSTTSSWTAAGFGSNQQITVASVFYKIEYTYDCIVPPATCTSESSMLNSASFTATTSAGTGGQHVIDNDLTSANYWQTDGANNSITIDYGQNYTLNGFTYYPTTNGNTVLAYTMQTSTDGVTFTNAATGSFPNYNTTTYRQEKGRPTTIRFSTAVNARYLRMIVAGSGKRVAEIIPLVCGIIQPDMTCEDVAKISSGTNEGVGKKVRRNLDNNWTVTHFSGGTGSPETSTYNYSSIANSKFYPAIVVGRAVVTPGRPEQTWATSPYGNAEWISATQDGQDVDSQGVIATWPPADTTIPNTYFYKYKFNISDPLLIASLKLRLDYYVDNHIVRVYVNGIDQNISSPDFLGYANGHEKSTLLDSDFQLGENELVVQIYSQPGYAGLLVQGIPACYCLKDPNTTSTGIDTKHGITLLKRAGAENNDNWPMVRKSAHTVLESNNKGFVPTRMATADLSKITNPVEGMLVFDTTAKCLKIYEGTAWKCFITPACPQ